MHNENILSYKENALSEDCMVYKFLSKAKWPKDLPTTEEDFNKNQLKDYIKNILSGTWQLKNRKDYTKVEMKNLASLKITQMDV